MEYNTSSTSARASNFLVLMIQNLTWEAFENLKEEA